LKGFRVGEQRSLTTFASKDEAGEIKEITDYYYQAGESTWTVTVERRNDQFRVTAGGRVYEVKLIRAETGLLVLEVEGRRLRADVAQAGPRCYVAIAGESWLLERVTARPRRPHRAGAGVALSSGELTAEMPGQILEVLVAPGEAVTAGQSLVVLEAMKMELRVTAPAAGRVRQVYCTAGQVVERGQALVAWEAGE
jgi:3-methylcrotonyl-CoA carboxylase alpha subunit